MSNIILHTEPLQVNFKFIAPYRLGKKQRRAILDARGYEVIIFPVGMEDMAEDYCKHLNKNFKVIT